MAVVAIAIAVTGLASVAALAATVGSAGPPPMCVVVALPVGLDLPGARGPWVPALTAYGTLRQQTMGNGAAVGDIDGDGFLDVLLLGQAGHHTRLFHNVPAPDGGRRFTDVT